MADVKIDYNDSYNTQTDLHIGSGTTMLAQSFLTNCSYTLNSIQLRLYRSGTITGNIRATLCTYTDYPDIVFTPITYGEIAASSITTGTSGAWYSFTMDSPTVLTYGIERAIVLTIEGTGTGIIYWRGRNDSYDGDIYHSYWYDDDWYLLTSPNDLTFRTYGVITAPGKAYNPDPYDTHTGIYVNTRYFTCVLGYGATSGKVYIDNQYQGDVSSGATSTYTLGSALDVGDHTWRVDSIYLSETTTGNTWSFAIIANPTLSTNIVDGYTSDDSITNTISSYMGYNFYAAATKSINKIQLKAHRYYLSSADILTVDVYQTDEDGFPAGDSLASAVFSDCFRLPACPASGAFDMDTISVKIETDFDNQISLVESTRYALVFSISPDSCGAIDVCLMDVGFNAIGYFYYDGGWQAAGEEKWINYTNPKWAYSFYIENDFTLVDFSFNWFHSEENPDEILTCDVKFDVYEADANGYPTGESLSTVTVDGETLTGSDTITLDEELDLTENQNYSVVVELIEPTEDDGCIWDYTNIWGKSKLIGYSGGSWYVSSGVLQLWFGLVSGLPEKPVEPAPENVKKYVKKNLGILEWEDGGAGQENAATAYDVFFGTESGDLSLISFDVADTFLTMPSGIDFSMIYYWRVDAKNDSGTTTGDEWSFWTEISPNYDRFPDYNPDYQWQYSDGQYQWLDIDVAGGGRYKNHLVIVGFNCIYYS